MSRWRMIILVLGLVTIEGASARVLSNGELFQCTSTKGATILVSDQYEEAVQYKDQLILGNTLGLVFLDMDDLEGEAVHIERLPGAVIEVIRSENQLWAIVAGIGLYVFEYQDDNTLPTLTNVYPVAGIRNAALVGENLFAAADGDIIYYHITAQGLLEVERKRVDIRKMAADEHLLYLHETKGSISIQPFQFSGFVGESKPLILGGNNVFYNFDYASGLLVVDALDGLKWLRFGEGGNQIEEGNFIEAQGRDILLGFAIDDSLLVLSFANRLEVHSYDGQRALTLLGSIDLPSFADVGITKIVPSGDFIFLLNTARQGRDWSLRSYDTQAPNLPEMVRRPANFIELVGAAAIGDNLYFASDREINILTPDHKVTSKESFDGPVTQISASDGYLFVAVSSETTFTDIYIYHPDAEGNLNQPVYEDQFLGSLLDLSQYGGSFAYLQFFRTTTEDNYNGHLLLQTGVDEFQRREFAGSVEIEGESPFRDFQIGGLGLVSHSRGQIRIQRPADMFDLGTLGTFLDSETIVSLSAPDDKLWIETLNGLFLAVPEGENIRILARHPTWHGVGRQTNNLILALNHEDHSPSRYHVLVEEEGLVYAKVSFVSSARPLLINEGPESVFIAEQAAISSYDCHCPIQDNRYLLPLESDLEIDLSTLLQESDVVTLAVFDRIGQMIGMQNLNTVSIGERNGQVGDGWLVDYNRVYQPHSMVLSSNVPLGPVISGFATRKENSRFAFQLPVLSGETLIAPHVPRAFNTWKTQLNVYNYLAGSSAQIDLFSASGQVVERDVSFGTPLLVPIGPDTFNPVSPWIRVGSNVLGTFLSGYEIIQNTAGGLAGAVPMTHETSRSIYIPFLAGNDDPEGDRHPWWTGLVLTNPNAFKVTVRLVGYDSDGEISYDNTQQVPASGQWGTSVEAWIRSTDPEAEVEWLTLLADEPITGMLLFATYDEAQMAALPLSGETSSQLIFSGSRSNDLWATEMMLVAPFRETTQLFFEAIDGQGEVIATMSREIGGRVSLKTSVRQLFSGGALRERIHTIRVTSNNLLSGFSYRNLRGTDSLEAFRAMPVK